MINNGQFQILLRRRQNQSIYPLPDGPTVNVIVQCDPLTGWAQYVPGDVDNTTAFMDIVPVDGWYDFSNFIEGTEKLSFTWDKTNQGDSNNTSTTQDGSNYDKGISSDLLFFDKAYHFIYRWLLATECQILNCVEVKIIDLIARMSDSDPAGNYRIFEIKSDNLDYAPVDDPCQFHIKLREQDEIWHCIHKISIWDDWQNWFNSTGTSTKEHPCFLTCIEPRPRLVQSARMAIMLFFHSIPITIIIDWISGAPSVTEHARKVLNANRFVDAPLIQTYIQNIAGKCGMTTDTIFDVGQHFEKLCLFYPQAGFMHESDDDAEVSPELTFKYDNRWLITIADLFDKLKIPLAAEWYVTPLNTIVFKHTKDLILLDPIYDFTAVGAEPIYNLRYSFNGDKKPAYGNYQYTDDGSDLASQEMSTLYSDIIDFDGPANNPMLEGELDKNFEFAPTGFVRDGRSKDYMRLLIDDGKFGALVLVVIISVVAAIFLPGVFTTIPAAVLAALVLIWVGDITIKSTSLKNEFVDGPVYTGAVRLTSEQTLQPRLLLWDGVSLQRAKVDQRVGLPVPNPYYNPSLTAYNVKNQIQTDNPNGAVYNYPMYIDGDFYDNLFQYHDPIDNPLKSLETHQQAKWSVDLCVDMLNTFGVFQNQYAQIGKVVKLEKRDGYDVYVRISNINVDYGAEQILITGTVLRRKGSQVDQETPGNIPVVTPEDSGSGLPGPTDTCLKWINNGTEDATVSYYDCEGAGIIDAIITPGGTFCSFEIISSSGGNIQATDVCGESGSGSSSVGPSCLKYINLDSNTALNVHYIDCDGVEQTNGTVASMAFLCTRELISFDCGNLVQVGLCQECIPPGEFIITQTSVQTAGRLGHFSFSIDAGRTGVVDWGDGSPLETFDSGFGGTMVLEHTYLIDGTYPQTFYFNDNANISLFVDDSGVEPPDVTFFSHTTNFTGLTGIRLYGVMDINTVIPPSVSHISFIEYNGSVNSVATSADLTTLPSLVTQLTIQHFPDLVSITGTPTTITTQFIINGNSSLASVVFTGTLCLLFRLIGNNLPESAVAAIPHLGNFGQIVIRQNFSVSDVNDILVYLDSFGTSSKSLVITQSPPATPSGAGATAVTNMQARSWFISSD